MTKQKNYKENQINLTTGIEKLTIFEQLSIITEQIKYLSDNGYYLTRR